MWPWLPTRLRFDRAAIGRQDKMTCGWDAVGFGMILPSNDSLVECQCAMAIIFFDGSADGRKRERCCSGLTAGLSCPRVAALGGFIRGQ